MGPGCGVWWDRAQENGRACVGKEGRGKMDRVAAGWNFLNEISTTDWSVAAEGRLELYEISVLNSCLSSYEEG